MGRRPRSGDIPWLPAHSILNWIGGDTYMLDLLWGKSRAEAGRFRFVSQSGEDCHFGMGLRPRIWCCHLPRKAGYRSNTQRAVSLFPATFCDLFPSHGLSESWIPRLLLNRKSPPSPQANTLFLTWRFGIRRLNAGCASPTLCWREPRLRVRRLQLPAI